MNEFVTTPEWVKHSVFYQIFPDRFAKSDKIEKPGNLESWESEPTVYGFKGGDLLGVAEKLDYLSDLGISAIYFNPIFQSASNHRYHTHDFFQIDPILGGDRAFEYLLKHAHSRGIRIVLDGVFNHASRGFFQFNHILETGAQSPYVDWFTINGFPLNAYGPGKPNYRCWWDLPELPEFNTDNPQVQRYIFDIARYWIDKGIDGWRLDVPFCIDDDTFWQEFRRIVKSANPDAYIVGEVPWEAQRWLQGDQFDAVMNYQFTQACLGFFGGPLIDRHFEKNMMGLPKTLELDAGAFSIRTQELLQLYPMSIVQTQLNLLDSHDMPRFINLVSKNWDSLKLAVLFQMTYPGAPCVYYGDEIGMMNGPSTIPEDCRYAFPWVESDWNYELLNHYRKCISIRNQYPALRVGRFDVVHAKDDVIVYKRSLEGQSLMIALNNSLHRKEIVIPIERLPDALSPGLIRGDIIENNPDGKLTLKLTGKSGEIFRLS